MSDDYTRILEESYEVDHELTARLIGNQRRGQLKGLWHKDGEGQECLTCMSDLPQTD